jgi:glutaredoxin
LSKAHVIVYSRPGCHLCDDAKEAIHRSGCEGSFTFEEINIETSRDLLLKYQFDIPVVTIDGAEAFRHRVNPNEFRNRIHSIGGNQI